MGEVLLQDVVDIVSVAAFPPQQARTFDSCNTDRKAMTPENERHLKMIDLVNFVGDNWRTVVGFYYLRDGFMLTEMSAHVVQSMDALRIERILDIEYRLGDEWRSAIDEVTDGRPAVVQREVLEGIVVKAVALGAALK
jgi:hypothetical protein